ncbi:unnamed protein product [Ambrosiozyma monospora]|uniref:Unnamed protein product n=1 Tax=Ambrosiozyma monospora TaxID=43982 RepID=A0ACB5TCJ8_AMBMO|nr:unnamed protein product [Ambrosiozyma monospora]
MKWIVQNWRNFILSGQRKIKVNRSLKLSITANTQDGDTACLPSLTNFISNNRDVLTASISIDGGSPSPLEYDLYLGLVKQCDFVSLDICDMDTDTPVDMKWINNISGLNFLSMSFHQESYFNIELNLQNFHSLKRLDLFGFFVDAPFFNNIPDAIESIGFEMKASGGSSIKLPLHLRNLEIRSKVLPKISNVKDLKNLRSVTINFTLDEGSESSGHLLSVDAAAQLHPNFFEKSLFDCIYIHNWQTVFFA